MSNTGARLAGQPTLRVYARAAAAPRRATATRYIEQRRADVRQIGSPGFARDEEDLREIAARSYDRGARPARLRRQLAAIIASATAPAAALGPRARVVIHGDEDQLVALAAAGRPPRRSRARGSCGSTAWATTCRAARGRGSSTRSPRTPPAPGSPPPSERRPANPLLKRRSVRCAAYLTNMCSHDASPTGRNKPLELLEREITELASHIHAATCRWLGLIAEFDRREGWGDWGCRSCAHWVSWRCGVAPVAAREHVRVARRLETMPLVRAAFADGRLSYSKVRALTRVEEVRQEDDLLSLAEHATAAQLERLVRAYRGVVAVERAEPERWVAWNHDADGSLLLRGRLPADEGALVLAALEASRKRHASVRRRPRKALPRKRPGTRRRRARRARERFRGSAGDRR